jgi:hypothetical protein
MAARESERVRDFTELSATIVFRKNAGRAILVFRFWFPPAAPFRSPPFARNARPQPFGEDSPGKSQGFGIVSNMQISTT